MTRKNFDLDIESDNLEGVYADSFIVGYDAYKFVMKFGQHQEEKEEVKFHSKIIVSPNDTKNLSEILVESLTEYENDHGHIDDQ